jgi:hypothetical protein
MDSPGKNAALLRMMNDQQDQETVDDFAGDFHRLDLRDRRCLLVIL